MDEDGVFFFVVGDGIGDFQLADKLMAMAEYGYMRICHRNQAWHMFWNRSLVVVQVAIEK